MNDKDLKPKKNSLINLKYYPDKTTNNSYSKINTNCQPKQPPNISLHYWIQDTKKKQLKTKQTKYPTHDIAQFYQLYQNQKTTSKPPLPFKPPKLPSQKPQQQPKQKKSKKELPTVHPIKSSKMKQSKLHTRQNKQPCLWSYQNQKKYKFQSLDHNQIQDQFYALHCKQKLMKKLKKTIGQLGNSLNHQPIYQYQLSTSPEHYYLHFKSLQQEIFDFQSKSTQFHALAQSQTLNDLFQKQKSYCSLQNYNCYLNKKQPEIDWFKRAVTMDWMIEILSQLGSKRQVFALSANYTDRYLTSTQNLPLHKLQLLACASMSLANKLQGISFNLQNLTKQLFTTTQVLQFQQHLVLILKWKLNPPTTNMWANRISKHWDMYIDYHLTSMPQILNHHLDIIKFKSQDSQGYKNFRMLMQYIDLTILDIHTLQYHNRQLAASFIYIVLNVKLGLYTQTQIVKKFPSTSKYLLEQTQLNVFYSQFLKQSFDFTLQDLLPTVQYCSTFLQLPLCFDLPNAINAEEQTQIEYSELCSLQTWNPANKRTIRHRNRLFG